MLHRPIRTYTGLTAQERNALAAAKALRVLPGAGETTPRRRPLLRLIPGGKS